MHVFVTFFFFEEVENVVYAASNGLSDFEVEIMA